MMINCNECPILEMCPTPKSSMIEGSYGGYQTIRTYPGRIDECPLLKGVALLGLIKENMPALKDIMGG